MSTITKSVSLIVSVVASWTATVAMAAPPSHAPAHGWRRQHDPSYVGYTGKQWKHDYGIVSGRCNREAIATVLGGVVGGVIGARVSDPEDRTVATVVGATIGALIGNRIGDRLDDADRGCIGHALEVAAPGQRVTWTNESMSTRYEITLAPDGARNEAACREFTLVALTEGTRGSSRRGVACQSRAGAWEIVDR